MRFLCAYYIFRLHSFSVYFLCTQMSQTCLTSNILSKTVFFLPGCAFITYMCHTFYQTSSAELTFMAKKLFAEKIGLLKNRFLRQILNIMVCPSGRRQIELLVTPKSKLCLPRQSSDFDFIVSCLYSRRPVKPDTSRMHFMK